MDFVLLVVGYVNLLYHVKLVKWAIISIIRNALVALVTVNLVNFKILSSIIQ